MVVARPLTDWVRGSPVKTQKLPLLTNFGCSTLSFSHFARKIPGIFIIDVLAKDKCLPVTKIFPGSRQVCQVPAYILRISCPENPCAHLRSTPSGSSTANSLKTFSEAFVFSSARAGRENATTSKKIQKSDKGI